MRSINHYSLLVLGARNSQKHHFKINRLALATWVYWFLLFYIVAALVYWYIALQLQVRQMTIYRIQELKRGAPDYPARLAHIEAAAQNKTIQYIGEGSTFLALILLSAIFVYRAVRRQFRLQQQQQHFMMAVTHELKTPIAVAKLNLETLKRFRLDEEKRQKIIQSALEETERLNTLANNILVSSQLEGGGYTLTREEMDLSSITNQLAGEFQQRYPERKWQLAIQPDLGVNADPLLIQLLVNNLVENAIKYSPKESEITIGLKKENKFLLLYVKDLGPGIREGEKKKIFEKFYRVGNETTRTAKGTGLGLYLCRKIAEDHHAHLAVADNQPRGSIFTVRFNAV